MMHHYGKKIQSNCDIAWTETKRTSSDSKKLVFKNMRGLSSKTL